MITNEEIFEVLKNISNSLQKDIWDYLAIVAPLVLSLIAIIISLYNSFVASNRKSVEAMLLWEEVQYRFIVAIRNSGKKTLVINQVKLIALNSNGKDELELGCRDNVWSIDSQKTFIKENEMITFAPIYGSIYDVFAYRGHCFDVSEENSSFNVFLVITDADGCEWRFDTHLNLGDLDCKLDAMCGKKPEES